jgi:hypothetical protein
VGWGDAEDPVDDLRTQALDRVARGGDEVGHQLDLTRQGDVGHRRVHRLVLRVGSHAGPTVGTAPSNASAANMVRTDDAERDLTALDEEQLTMDILLIAGLWLDHTASGEVVPVLEAFRHRPCRSRSQAELARLLAQA